MRPSLVQSFGHETTATIDTLAQLLSFTIERSDLKQCVEGPEQSNCNAYSISINAQAVGQFLFNFSLIFFNSNRMECWPSLLAFLANLTTL